MNPNEFVVIGAGPYGLAASTHLRAGGASVRSFGRPMSFWEEHMPAGMCLRSSWGASTISDPTGRLSLDRYQAELGVSLPRPLPLRDFIAYGHWYQRLGVPDLDQREVTRVERLGDHFAVHLDDSEVVTAGRVVVATGLAGHEHVPPQLADAPPERVVHCVAVTEPAEWAGRRVAVIGAGQSAVETAVLLAEAGATVEVVGRVPQIHWLTRSNKLHTMPAWVTKLLYAPTDVGPPGLSWVVGKPDLYRRLPRPLRDRAFRRSIRPAASGWLQPRAGRVTFTMGCQVTRADLVGDTLRVSLDDGTTRDLDYIALGTGYEVDVTAHPLLAKITGLATDGGLPVLDGTFQSSVPGLYFVGAASAGSFGPVMRFVSGTWFTGGRIASAVR